METMVQEIPSETEFEGFPPKLWSRLNGWLTLLIFLILYFGLSLASGLFVTESSDPFLLTLLALLSNVIACFGSVLLINKFFQNHSLQKIGFRKVTLQWIIFALIAGVGFMIIRAILAALILLVLPFMDQGVDVLQDAFVTNNTNIISQLLTLLIGGIIAPIGEELFFRGFIHNWLRNRLNMWPAILLSSLIFSAFHLIPLQMIMVFPMGLITAWSYEKSKSLVTPIILHIINNFIALSFTILASYLV